MPPSRPLLGLSTRRLGARGVWGEHRDRTRATSLLREAVALGVDLVEVVATTSGPGADDLVRDALHPYPPGLTLAWRAGAVGPDRLSATLKRLAVARLDLLVVAADQAEAALALVEDGLAVQVALAPAAGGGTGPDNHEAGSPPAHWARRTSEGIAWPDGSFTPVLAAETVAEVERAAAAVIPPAAGPG